MRYTILAQPLNPNGTTCGVSAPLRVCTPSLQVITPYHHYPLLSTAVLDKADDLFGCPRVSLPLELTWVSGQAMVVHTLRPHDERPSWGGVCEHA